MSRARTLLVCAALLPAMLGAQGGAAFMRRVAPFPVADRTGTPMPEPFLGGFDVPRPQLVDIDGDGDLDLFVQERSNALMFFERVDGRYVWRTDQYQGLAVGEWSRFVDLDGDGLMDLLGESPISYIRAWRNVGTKTAARFAVAADSLRDGDGVPLAADRQNILNLVDIDCNGRLDLFLGRVAGTVDRYEAIAGSAINGVPRFGLVTERFEGIEVLGPVPGEPNSIQGRGSRHGANTLAFGDIDGDGDPDLFWGDYFEPGLLLFENRARACGTPDLRAAPQRFPVGAGLLTSGYNAPAIGDVDGDGLLDVVMGVIGGAFFPARTAVDNLYYLRQSARGVFEKVTARLLRTVDVGNESVPTLTDLDGDGDLDLLVGNKIEPNADTTGSITWFENTGTTREPAFRDRGPLPIHGEFHYAPTSADLDGDGLPDLIVGTWRDRVQWWRNRGSRSAPEWTLADTALVILTRGSNTTPALSDLDGDGDLDMIVGEASGQLNLYRNVGSRTAPKFELVSDQFQDIDVGRRSAPTFADLDGDGRADLLLGSEEGGLQLWRNVTANGVIRFERDPSFSVPTDPYSAPAVGALRGDGSLSLIVGAISGGLLYYERPK